MTALGLIDIVRALGAGEQVVVAATLGLVVLYLFRGRKLAKLVVGLAGTAWLVGVAVGIAVIGIILAGWVDPRPSAFISDVGAAASAAGELAAGAVDDWLADLLEGLVG